MSIKEACVSVFTNWNNFSGRACRSEFWYFCLALFIAGFLITFFETILYASIEDFPTIFTYGMEFKDTEWQSVQNPIGPLTLVFNAIILFPYISVTSRRLQDRGISGWWQLSYLTFIGVFVIFILLMLPSKEDENKWGKNPLLDM
tara:strand:- start:1366 stop:1800 length:435 start_codon:yes stop_codon:yes gene_type:complete